MNQGREIAPVEELLRSAAASLAYPPTPPIARAVQARLREAGRGPARAEHWWARPAFRLALAAAALVVAVTIALPQSRSALAKFFGLSNVRIESQPTAGPTPPALSPQSFARPSSIEDARSIVDFALRFPTSDGDQLEPDAVYLQGEDAGRPVVIFVYEDEGYDLYQSRLGIFSKGGPDPSLVHELSFAGHNALWIDEGGHIATFLDEQDRLVVESRRTVGRATLLWEEDGITYRLETSLSQQEAIDVAESLKGT